jgi:ubiquinone/menaquinone biosynthesis C-methylase UbiE
VIGFDASPDMLVVARRNLAAFSNAEFREATGDQLPVAEGTFGGVFANTRLHHAPDSAKTIKELARTLKPDGVFCALPISILTITNGSANKWLTYGWALSAMTFGVGMQIRDLGTSMLISWKDRAARPRPTGRKNR